MPEQTRISPFSGVCFGFLFSVLGFGVEGGGAQGEGPDIWGGEGGLNVSGYFIIMDMREDLRGG